MTPNTYQQQKTATTLQKMKKNAEKQPKVSRSFRTIKC